MDEKKRVKVLRERKKIYKDWCRANEMGTNFFMLFLSLPPEEKAEVMKTNLVGNDGGENGGDAANTTTVVIIRQDSTSSKSTNFDSANEAAEQKALPTKSSEFDISPTSSTIIVSYGQLDMKKRYVSEKEVDTGIGLADAGTIADECLRESTGTQYESQKINPESLRRVLNSLTSSNFLQNACDLLESELEKRKTFDTLDKVT